MPAKKTTIITADDDPQLLRMVTRNLQMEDYEVIGVSDGQQALEQIEARMPDLALLDLNMPRLDGFGVLTRVREFSNLPIIIITARGADQDKIRGLDLGADDYLTKPFSVEELLARVRAVLRRTQNTGQSESGRGVQAITTVGELTIDYGQRRVMMAGKDVDLTPVEYRVLAYLAQNVGRVITQDLLLGHVWGEEYEGESHLLQVNINRLRRKIEPDPAQPHYLLTKTGVGYMLSSTPEA